MGRAARLAAGRAEGSDGEMLPALLPSCWSRAEDAPPGALQELLMIPCHQRGPCQPHEEAFLFLAPGRRELRTSWDLLSAGTRTGVHGALQPDTGGAVCGCPARAGRNLHCSYGR